MIKLFAIVLSPLFILACGRGAPDDTHRIEDQQQALLSSLPTPRVRLSAERVWSKPAEKQRAAEVESHLLTHMYLGHRIVDTVQTRHGTIIDYLDAGTFKGPTLRPPELPPRPEAAGTVGRPETEESPDLMGPPGSIPFVRPDFGRYISGESGQASLAAFLQNRIPYRTDGLNRLYGGYKYLQDNRGAYGHVTQFSADAVENGTFTVMEMAVSCPRDSSTDAVGILFSRDLANFTDQQLRLHVEFLSQKYGSSWDDYYGLVAYAGRSFAPGVVFTPSTVVGGGTAWENYFQIMQDGGGNWWVYAWNSWLGYYPPSLFNAGLDQKGCRIGWYGEVFDQTPSTWTTNSMGNGTWASAGFNGYAAYWRTFAYLQPDFSAWSWPAFSSMSQSSQADSKCYTTSAISPNGGPFGDPIFFLGGPGGKNFFWCR